jgi:hypothetical protein
MMDDLLLYTVNKRDDDDGACVASVKLEVFASVDGQLLDFCTNQKIVCTQIFSEV